MHIKKFHIPDWAVRTKADKAALEAGYYWDDTQAIKVKNFIERYCCQSKGGWTGLPELLEFQLQDIIYPFYSWYDSSGIPRFETLICMGPRKFGKSFLCGACIPAFHLATERRADILSLASTVDQAKINFNTIAEFKQSPELNKRLHIKDHRNQILDKQSKSVLRVLASTAVQGSSGWNTSVIVLDEFCEWQASTATSIYSRLEDSDIAKKGGGGRKIIISTPQDDFSHPGRNLWQTAKNILNGDSEELTTLPVIYGADPDDDPSKEETWKKAQPALGVIITTDKYRKRYARSKDDPHRFAAFRTLLLGQWVGAVNGFINPNTWHALKEDYTEDQLIGLPCLGGCDWGGRYDLNCTVWLFLDNDDRLALLPRFYLPRKIMERKAKNESKDYFGWASSGLINLCEGETIDVDWWKSLVEEDIRKFNPVAISIDPHNMEAQRQWMEEELYQSVIEVKNNVWNVISPLTSLFEKFIKDGKFKHNGHPVADWNVENLRIRINNQGLIMPDKDQGKAKIDFCSSLITALEGYELLIENDSWCGIV